MYLNPWTGPEDDDEDYLREDDEWLSHGKREKKPLDYVPEDELPWMPPEKHPPLGDVLAILRGSSFGHYVEIVEHVGRGEFRNYHDDEVKIVRWMHMPEIPKRFRTEE